jgi:hypothetical protein
MLGERPVLERARRQINVLVLADALPEAMLEARGVAASFVTWVLTVCGPQWENSDGIRD